MSLSLSLTGLLLATQSATFNPEEVINALKYETDPVFILTSLQQLATDIEAYINQLQQEDTYRPDDFYYAMNLKYYLRPVRENMRCDSYQLLVSDYFKSSFDELEPPIEDVWQVVKKICR